MESDSEDTNDDSSDDEAEIEDQDTSADEEEVEDQQIQNANHTQDEDEDNIQITWLPDVQTPPNDNSFLLWVIFNAVSGVFAIYLKLMIDLRDILSTFEVIILLVPWCLVVVIWMYGRGSNIEEEGVEDEDEERTTMTMTTTKSGKRIGLRRSLIWRGDACGGLTR